MEKLFYLLAFKGKLKIDISKYCAYNLVQKDGYINITIDNHDFYDFKQRIIIENPREFKQFFDPYFYEKYAKKIIDEMCDQHKVLMQNIQREKIFALQMVENNKNFSPTYKESISQIVNLVCENDRFYLKNTPKFSAYLTLADDTNKTLSPYSDLHIQLVKNTINDKGERQIEYPDLCEEEIISLIAKCIKANPTEIYNKIFSGERQCARIKEQRQEDFAKLKTRYIRKSKPKQVEQIIEA
ncbi:MAG: hypothetical protein PHQ62_03090 [Clostridia bacterium]|nr:hypothetical protein [Clostridia bacterium]